VQLSALTHEGDTVAMRVYNASEQAVDARIDIAPMWSRKRAVLVGLLGDERGDVEMREGVIALPMKAWEIATVRLR
jgi:hypothetical protein